MKNTITRVMAAFLLFSTSYASADGGGAMGGGGGDVCEERIRNIVKDITTWVTAGGASAFDFKGAISATEYNAKMLSYLIPIVGKESNSTLIECIPDKVQVEGINKMCRWDDNGVHTKITCNTDDFLKLAPAEQYRLTHHEIASIAKIEPNNGAISDYFLSDQITDSLEANIEWRLVVRSQNNRAGVVKNMRLLNEHYKKVASSLIVPDKSDYVGYEGFLEQPDTGIMRIFPRGNSTILDGVMNGGGAVYSFVTRSNEYGYGSDLCYGNGRNQFSVGFAGVDYGFMANLGEIDIRNVDLTQPAIQDALSHQSPNGLPEPAWRTEKYNYIRRINGVIFSDRTDAKIGQTYVLRSINESRSDIAVVFQVLRQDPIDSSLIIAWKIVKRFEIPILKR